MWVPHDVRDQVVDFVRRWSEKTEIGAGRFIHWLGVQASKFYDWREGASTNTTVGSPVISGWSRGRSKRSSGSIATIHWKDIDD